MKNIALYVAFLSVWATVAGCQRATEINPEHALQHTQDSLREAHTRDSLARLKAVNQPKSVNQLLRADAKLARTQSFEQFARHMRSRLPLYRQYNELKYEDGYVSIKMEGGELKIETPNGKAKFSKEEIKIKTDTYKRKIEKE